MAGAQGMQAMQGSQGAQQMSGGLGNQYSMTPPQGMPLPPNQMPQSVQRMPGGFGLSPQLLQQIASLQSRQVQAQPPPAPAPNFNQQAYQPVANPYQPSPTQVTPGSQTQIPIGGGRYITYTPGPTTYNSRH